MTNCLVVQHVAPESPARSVTRCGGRHRWTCGATTPEIRSRTSAGDYDGMVVMGGPMSARPTTTFRAGAPRWRCWPTPSASAMPTLGVCLGAQLLALAGGRDGPPGEARPRGRLGARRAVDAAAADDPLLGDCSVTSMCCTGTATRTNPGRVGATGEQRALPPPGLPGGRRGLGPPVPPGGHRGRGRRVRRRVRRRASCTPGGAAAIRPATPAGARASSGPSQQLCSTASPPSSPVPNTGMELGTVSRTFPVREL